VIDIPTILLAIDFNLTNITNTGILRWAMQPYYDVLGNFTWGAIFGIIGAALYANERSIGIILLYLLLVGIFFGIILPLPLIYIFGLLFTFVMTIVFYRAFVEQRT